MQSDFFLAVQLLLLFLIRLDSNIILFPVDSAFLSASALIPQISLFCSVFSKGDICNLPNKFIWVSFISIVLQVCLLHDPGLQTLLLPFTDFFSTVFCHRQNFCRVFQVPIHAHDYHPMQFDCICFLLTLSSPSVWGSTEMGILSYLPKLLLFLSSLNALLIALDFLLKVSMTYSSRHLYRLLRLLLTNLLATHLLPPASASSAVVCFYWKYSIGRAA